MKKPQLEPPGFEPGEAEYNPYELPRTSNNVKLELNEIGNFRINIFKREAYNRTSRLVARPPKIYLAPAATGCHTSSTPGAGVEEGTSVEEGDLYLFYTG